MTRLFDQDDEYTELRPERRSAPKVVVVLAVLVAALAGVGIGVKHWYSNQIDPSGPQGDPVTVVIPRGTTINGAGTLLSDQGVIGSAAVFRYWVRGKDINVQAGSYRFRENSSFDQALAVIRKGPAPVVVTRVTIPEGLTLQQMSERLAKLDPRFSRAAMLQALADPAVTSGFRPEGQTSLEGLLFPSTYEIGSKDTAATLVSRMAAEMQVIGEQNDIQAGPVGGSDPVPELDAYQVLTVASLIQAESGNPEESPKIARVIYNRLLSGSPLGIDATSRYLAQQTGTEVDFESDSPFNTRRQKGLPPTPIGGPGEAAIKAALHPADGPWIWYVLEEKGRHFFTASESEFLQKKRECEQKDLGCG